MLAAAGFLAQETVNHVINGENVIPLGHGDVHDPKHDGYERKASFREIKNIPDRTKFGLLLYQVFSRAIYSIAFRFCNYNLVAFFLKSW